LLTRIDHVAIGVADLRAGIDAYRRIGFDIDNGGIGRNDGDYLQLTAAARDPDALGLGLRADIDHVSRAVGVDLLSATIADAWVTFGKYPRRSVTGSVFLLLAAVAGAVAVNAVASTASTLIAISLVVSRGLRIAGILLGGS